MPISKEVMSGFKLTELGETESDGDRVPQDKTRLDVLSAVLGNACP